VKRRRKVKKREWKMCMEREEGVGKRKKGNEKRTKGWGR
jgi:hypothetical protein